MRSSHQKSTHNYVMVKERHPCTTEPSESPPSTHMSSWRTRMNVCAHTHTHQPSKSTTISRFPQPQLQGYPHKERLQPRKILMHMGFEPSALEVGRTAAVANAKEHTNRMEKIIHSLSCKNGDFRLTSNLANLQMPGVTSSPAHL